MMGTAVYGVVTVDSWKEHLAFSSLFEIAFILIMYFWKHWYLKLEFISIFQLLVIAFISPLILDLDHKQGKLREGLTFLGLMIGVVGVIGYYIGIDLSILMVMGIAISAPAFLLFYITDHRGFIHSIPFCIIYSIGIYLILQNIQLAILGLLGSYTHLLGDKEPIKLW